MNNIKNRKEEKMEVFVLKLMGIICITLFAITIVISRRDDIEITSVVIATIFELLGIIFIYVPISEIITLISELIK